jgi:hypothetical protein
VERGVGEGCRASGVSDGFAEPDFLGDFSGAGVCFFFFGRGVSSSELLFFFADFVFFGVLSGVSLGLAEDSSPSGVFFGFGFALFGDGDGDALRLGFGLGVASASDDGVESDLRYVPGRSTSLRCA